MGELSISGMLGGGSDDDFAAGEPGAAPGAGAAGKRGVARGTGPPAPSIVRIVPGPFGVWQPIVKTKLVPATKWSQRFLAIEVSPQENRRLMRADHSDEKMYGQGRTTGRRMIASASRAASTAG